MLRVLDFNDGNLFDELSLDTEMCMPNPKMLLRLAVETFLLPKLGEHIELYDANTSHNRVRIDDAFKNTFESIEITITGEDIFNMLDSQTV